jgi:hypothetical protein
MTKLGTIIAILAGYSDIDIILLVGIEYRSPVMVAGGGKQFLLVGIYS